MDTLVALLRVGAARGEETYILCDNAGQLERLEELVGGRDGLPPGTRSPSAPCRAASCWRARSRRCACSPTTRSSAARAASGAAAASAAPSPSSRCAAEPRRLRRAPRPRHRPVPRPRARHRRWARSSRPSPSSTPTARSCVCRSTGSTSSSAGSAARREARRRRRSCTDRRPTWKNLRRRRRRPSSRWPPSCSSSTPPGRLAERPPYPADSKWQKEMESSFLYEDTPDQRQATADVKRDMESRRPMDRLICGDVGYGKTEIAIRAAFKAVQDGRQVAVLAPTTILAEQHLHTFRQRLAGYPVRIEAISRFRTAKEQQDILAPRRRQRRHRRRHAPPLEPDVVFRNLGMLVIDEEQRFGVKQKERLKELRKQHRRADADGHADPAHAALLAHRPARPHAAADAAARPHAHHHARAAVGRRGHRGRHPPRARPRRTGLLRAQPRAVPRHRRGERLRALVPDAPSASRTARCRRRSSTCTCASSSKDAPDPAHHVHHRERPRRADGEHAHRGPRRLVRPGPALPDPRPRRPLAPPRILLPARARRRHARTPRSGCASWSTTPSSAAATTSP
jgi:hypothetical protein